MVSMITEYCVITAPTASVHTVHAPSGTERLDATFWPITLHQFLIEEVYVLRRVVYQAYYFYHNVPSISQ